ncbi:PREDICTED: uncharacterized protein LOC106792608 [Polistes canadensis]|uniref:uncharacterized protein LOC106792608 n=1 Tax=Polistes canadensis TaxID=91411 RepID=UPI0007190729|nr:PREDICTED: uncharacterized protein LOC106792608 [Polistes canadensis]XP_014614566.1 PREDICTED: uncharacterized protein LOC106792608 [Polistes canadensis]
MLTANNSYDDEDEQQQQQQPDEEEPSMFPTERIISFENAIVSNSRRNRNARRQLRRMVSNSTNTIEITPEMNLGSFFGSNPIVTENLIEYGAALHSIQFGMQNIHEPINVTPGLFINQEDESSYQSVISFDDYTNENNINESNMANG